LDDIGARMEINPQKIVAPFGNSKWLVKILSYHVNNACKNSPMQDEKRKTYIAVLGNRKPVFRVVRRIVSQLIS
jgi:hypothetical protein